MRLKLRTRIAAAFILVVLVVTSFATVFAVAEGRTEIQRSIVQNQHLVGQGSASSFRGFLDGAQNLLTTTAGQIRSEQVSPVVDERALADIIDPVLGFGQMFSTIVVGNGSGTPVFVRPTDARWDGASLAAEPAFQEVSAGAASAIGFDSEAFGTYWVVPVPQTNRSGTPHVLVGVLRDDRWQEALFANLPPDTAGVLRDATGRVIVSTDPALDLSVILGEATDVGIVGNARADTASEPIPEVDGYILTSEPLDVIAAQILLLGSDELIKTLESRLIRNAILTAGILATCAILLALHLSRVVAYPLQSLEKATKEMANGRLETRVRANGAAEFRELAQSFNRMAGRLQRDRASLLAWQTELEGKVQERTEDLARRQADMEMFFYATTHDLKGPAISVASLVDFMREDLERPGGLPRDELDDYIARIDHSASSMEAIIQQILQFAKVERDELVFTHFDLGSLVASVVDGTRAPARQQGVRLVMDGGPLMVESDRDRIEHILMNLVGNGVKYMDGRRDGRVTVTWGTHQNRLFLEVADNGPGIPSELMSSIFQPFKRSTAGHTPTSGSGLGLHIVHRMVESLGGTITVETSEGRGTRFRIFIPLRGPPATATQPPSRVPTRTNPSPAATDQARATSTSS